MIPKPDELDLDFYQAVVKAGQLCLQRCSDCGGFTHPPRYYCPLCSSGAFTFPPVSGNGKVYSYTVSHMSVEQFIAERRRPRNRQREHRTRGTQRVQSEQGSKKSYA